MFNNATFNRVAINAVAAATALLATAGWSATAVVTSAVPTITTHAAAGWACGVSGAFAGSEKFSARATWTAGATATGQAAIRQSAAGGMTAGATFTGYLLRNVPASAGFDTHATFYALANAKLGEGTWTAGVLNTDLVAIKNGCLRGGMGAGATMAGDAGGINRQVTASWAPMAALWMEPTVTSGGVKRHYAYAFPVASAALANTANLTTTFTHGVFGLAYCDWAARPHARFAGRGALLGGGTLAMSASRVAFGQGAWAASAQGAWPAARHTVASLTTLSAGAGMSAQGGLLQQGAAALSAGALMSSCTPGTVWSAQGALSVSAGITAAASTWHSHLADGVWSAEVGWLAAPGVHFHGSAGWSGAVNGLFTAFVTDSDPAPAERTFYLGDEPRGFVVSMEDRNFEVTG